MSQPIAPSADDGTDEPNPALVFNTLNAHQQSAALRGAIDLDLFTAIAAGHQTAQALAVHCEADPRGVRILCDFLVVHGLLTKQHDTYGLTATSARFLDRRSPQYMGSIARFINSPHLLDAFRDVAQVVRRGTTQLEGSGTVETEYEGWVDFARCMVPMMITAAQFIGTLVAERAPGAIRVLDLAAGHGMFGIEIMRQNPEALVVALDWPRVLAVAEENATAAGVRDRLELLPGDALTADYGGPYDVVLATNFFHHFDCATCISLMKRIRDCLATSGIVVTLEFVPNEDRVSPPVPATFAMMMLATTPAGDAYTFTEYESMWHDAGLGSSEIYDVPSSPQQVILTQPAALSPKP